MSLEDDVRAQILRDINLTGAADSSKAKIGIIIASRFQATNVITLSGGLPKVRPNIAKLFILLVGQPRLLEVMNPLEIRCCFCKRVISYPAWYWRQVYAVNQIHYFVCFDKDSPLSVNTKCYRRE